MISLCKCWQLAIGFFLSLSVIFFFNCYLYFGSAPNKHTLALPPRPPGRRHRVVTTHGISCTLTLSPCWFLLLVSHTNPQSFRLFCPKPWFCMQNTIVRTIQNFISSNYHPIPWIHFVPVNKNNHAANSICPNEHAYLKKKNQQSIILQHYFRIAPSAPIGVSGNAAPEFVVLTSGDAIF